MNRPAPNHQRETIIESPRGAKILPRQSPDNNPPLFHYFFHLDERFAGVGDFKDKWGDIPNDPFNAKGYALILNKTLRFVQRFQGPESDKRALYNYVQNNLNIWEQAAISQISDFRGQTASLALNGFSYFQREPSTDLWEKLERQILQNIRKNDFDSQSIALTLNAYAHFGRNMPVFLWNALKKEFEKRIQGKEADAQNIRNSLYACAILDNLYPDSDYQDLALFLKKYALKNIDGKRARRQVFDSFLHFGWTSPCEYPGSEGITSYSEQQLKRWFDKAGFNTERPSNLLPYFEDAVDFPARKNEQTLLVERDGPMHFLADPTHQDPDNPRYNGSTIFQSRLIHRQRPDLPILRDISPDPAP